MGTSRHITESQLDRAKAALAVRVKALEGKGVAPEKFRNDPQWRKLDARVRQIGARLRKVAQIETNNAEVAKLKEERLARIAAEIAERKAGPAAKKPKPEKEKEKGKGEAKGAKKDKEKEKEKAPKKEKAEKPPKAE